MSGRPRVVSDDALLSAAARAIRRGGTRTTSEAIAREAGVSKGLLFWRYRTKQELIAAVIDRESRLPEQLLERVRHPGGGPVAQTMAELGAELLRILRRIVPFAELMRSNPDPDGMPGAFAHCQKALRRLVQSCADYFEAQVTAGQLPPSPSQMLARIFFGAILERVLAESMAGSPVAAESDPVFLRYLVDLVLHGALARSPAQRIAL
jgi:AcrR family transcriptional regulator